MPIGRLIVPLFLLVLPMAMKAQQSDLIDCEFAPPLDRFESRPISLGVINGKARNLVKPQFPAAARAVGLSGVVAVQVVIDPRGCVVEAKAVSGHPLLRFGSAAAARGSSFYPVHLSGIPVWVNGVITYNYISHTSNWLELGFVSDSPDRLIERLPADFDDLRDDLNSRSYFDRRRDADSIADWISGRLISEPKDRWLFEVGRHMVAIKNRRSYDEHIAHLQALFIYPPEEVKPQLIEFLERFIDGSYSDTVDCQIKFFEERIYYLGS
ncbi:MAG TPA: energy transducer TonB [Pyrinomonadaceae bacterium]